MADLKQDGSSHQETVVSYLETLTPEQTLKLVDDSPFTGTVLAAGVDSAIVADNVQDGLDAEYVAMTPDQRARIDVLADRIRTRIIGGE